MIERLMNHLYDLGFKPGSAPPWAFPLVLCLVCILLVVIVHGAEIDSLRKRIEELEKK